MQKWYSQYWSQCWYSNTFLVHKYYDIAKATGGDKEWNNITDSGCNLTCIAMIIGIDPAYLSHSLRELTNFYAPDKGIPANNLLGKPCSLVWDQNKPNKKHMLLKLESLWHNHLGEINIELQRKERKIIKNLDDARSIVSSSHDKGLHVICGSTDHSHLVAGHNGKDFYLWDPDLDDDDTSVQDNLAGKYTLDWLFNNIDKRRNIEFWIYSLKLDEL